MVSSKDCPRYIKELEICQIRSDFNCGYREADKIYDSRHDNKRMDNLIEDNGQESNVNGTYMQHARSNEQMETSLDERDYSGSDVRGGSDLQIKKTVVEIKGLSERTQTGVFASIPAKSLRNSLSVVQSLNPSEEEKLQSAQHTSLNMGNFSPINSDASLLLNSLKPKQLSRSATSSSPENERVEKKEI